GEAILGNASAPAGIERLIVEDSVAASKHVLRVHRIGNAEPRSKPFVPDELRHAAAETRSAPLVTRERQPPGSPARAWVCALGIEEGKAVPLFLERRVRVPADSVIDGQLGSHSPGIAHKPRPGMLAWIVRGDCPESGAAIINLLEKEAGNGVAAGRQAVGWGVRSLAGRSQIGHVRHTRLSVAEVEVTRLAAVRVDVARDPPVLSAELELVLAPDPGQHIVGDRRRTPGDVPGVDAR